MRTTPTIGGVGSARHSQYPPAAATTNEAERDDAYGLAPSHAAAPLRLTRNGGHHREREIDDRQAPEPAPIARHLPEGGAQLIDADDAVDREIRREDIARGEHRLGDRFARPGETRQEELRQAGAEEDERRGLRVLEPGAGRLAHEARRQDEHRAEREQLQRLAERGKAVEARQHDEIERERRQIDGQVRDAASEHARERSAAGLRQRDDGQQRRADQQHLLQDQHEGRRHDVAGIAADRVEDRLQQNVGRARAASVALTRLPSVRAPPAASSDDSVLIATAMPFAIVLKMNR